MQSIAYIFSGGSTGFSPSYFNLDYEPPLDVHNQLKHIVQIRNPIASVISDFEWALSQTSKNKQLTEGKKNHPITDTLSDWLHFAPKQFEYRNRFLEKWILNNPWLENDQYYFLDYDAFLTKHEEKLRELIQFVYPDEDIDEESFRFTIDKNPSIPKRDPGEFQFAETLSDFVPIYESTWEACKQKLNLVDYD